MKLESRVSKKRKKEKLKTIAELTKDVKKAQELLREAESSLEEALFIHEDEDAYRRYAPFIQAYQDELEYCEALLEEEIRLNELDLAYEEMGW